MTGGGDAELGAARRKVAIVLFNLGGPDRPEAIKPFLLNLFLDPAILRVPFFVRPFLARIIARARVEPATANYALLGGKSPLLGLTQEQAVRAGGGAAGDRGEMLHRHALLASVQPGGGAGGEGLGAGRGRAAAAVSAVLDHDDGQFADGVAAGGGCGSALAADTTTVCCYPVDPAYAAATAALVKAAYDRGAGRAGSGGAAAGAVLGAWPAGGDHPGRRSVSVAGGADGRGGAGGLGRGGGLHASATSRARRRRNGSNPAPRRRSSGRRRTGRRCWWCRSRSCPNIPRRWWNSTSSIATWR